MNRLTKEYIAELQKLYAEHLQSQNDKIEKTYNRKLSGIYESAFELVPEEATISLRDEGRQKLRTLNYLKGECDTFDQRGDMYPTEIEDIEMVGGEKQRNYECNIIGAIIGNNQFYNIGELQKLELQNEFKNSGDSVHIKTPYNKLYLANSATLLYSKCWRYLVCEEKYKEFFKYIAYEHICKSLGGEADTMYMKKLERIKQEIKTNFMVKMEEYKARNIVSLNYFGHRRH